MESNLERSENMMTVNELLVAHVPASVVANKLGITKRKVRKARQQLARCGKQDIIQETTIQGDFAKHIKEADDRRRIKESERESVRLLNAFKYKYESFPKADYITFNALEKRANAHLRDPKHPPLTMGEILFHGNRKVTVENLKETIRAYFHSKRGHKLELDESLIKEFQKANG